MSCEQCPFIQSIETKMAESSTRLSRSQELTEMSVVSEAQNALTSEIIATLPDGPQKEAAQEALELSQSMPFQSGQMIDIQADAEANFLVQLGNLVDFAVTQCSGGPRLKRKIFGGEKLICTSQSTVVDKEFKR